MTKPAQFERVRIEGRAIRGRRLILGVLENSAEPAWRAGFITSKRIGSAVVRNRVRRRLREIVRLHQHDLRCGFWLVTIARASASRATYRELEDEWLRLGSRASILRP